MRSALRTSTQFVSLNRDGIEKIVAALLLGGLIARMVPNILQTGAILPLLLVASEAMVVLFLLIRRPTTAISDRGWDWTVGFLGTLVALLAIPPQGEPIVPTVWCGFVMVCGFALQISAKLTLRRSFGVIAANRGVKAGGPYRYVRHPMYAGYILTHIGFLLGGPSLWNAAIYGIGLGLAVARIAAEERVLMLDGAYRALAERVRYRLIPFVY